MVEYGNGVSQSTGIAGGSHSGQAVDAGAAVGQFITNSIHTLSTMPPAELVLGFVVLVVGLMILKRAF
jgi:hypothetical protein